MQKTSTQEPPSSQTQISQTSIKLNDITSFLMDSRQANIEKIEQNLSSLFDIIITIEKKEPQLLQNFLEMGILCEIIQKYNDLMTNIIKGFIIVFGNCKQKGILASYLLNQKIGNLVIKSFVTHISLTKTYDEDYSLNLLASFLKAYHHHFTSEKELQNFIDSDDNFILLTVCCKFYNCPQQITRTSIMNIIMTLLKMPLSEKFIYDKHNKLRSQLEEWSCKLCKQLRNQLKDLDQELMAMGQEDCQFLIHSINDKIVLWQDLSQLSHNFFVEPFYREVMIPLLIGSLNIKGIPLFTLKFSLFIISKLITVISNLNLLPKLGELLFQDRQIEYKEQQLQKAYLLSFKLKSLLQKDKYFEADEEVQKFKGINSFFTNVLKSKDSRFLEIGCNLLLNFIKEFTRKEQNKPFYESLGFTNNNPNILTFLSEILINQFRAIHSIETTKMVCSTLINLQPSHKAQQDEIKNLFFHNYRIIIKDTQTIVEKGKEVWPFLSQIFQYDLVSIFSETFNFKPKFKTDSSLLLSYHYTENDKLPFLEQLPQTHQETLRYNITKFLLLKKFCDEFIDEEMEEIVINKYILRLQTAEDKYIRPGEYMKLPIKNESYRCKIIDKNNEIPNCLLLDDDNSFIVGFLDGFKIRIIINIKYKHVSAQILTKSKKALIEILIRRYDNKINKVVPMSDVALKNLEVGLEYFKIKKSKCMQRQINIIMNLLKYSLEAIPSMSLI